MAWGAVMSACKAAAAVLERETHSRAEEKGAQFMLIKPMVVVDGGLYSAELREGELLIEEVTAAPLRFHYQSGAYRERTEYAVDVVTLHGLDAYLKDAERRIAHFLETLQSVSVEAEAGSDE